jgi:sensor histidine kinase YesM
LCRKETYYRCSGNRSNEKSNQAIPASAALVYFDGDYRIGDGEWQKIEKGNHIPATKGDVTLRGQFHMLTPYTEEYIGVLFKDIPIAFYTNHINVTIKEGDNVHVMDIENLKYGASACGQYWMAYSLINDNTEPIEIIIHNPHLYGNDTAIDELISNFAIWGSIEFEKDILKTGESQRNIGLLFVIVSLVILGVALFSTIIHVKNCLLIWLFGFIVFFAGTYFIFTSDGIPFWNESIISNTLLFGISMMFYMFFISLLGIYMLNKTKKVGIITISIVGFTNALFLLLPLLTNLYFYDLLSYWTIVQCVANIVLCVCIIKDFIVSNEKTKWFCSILLLPLVFFILDAIMIYLGKWKMGISSQYVFAFIFVIALVVVLMVIPQNINASMKAKELEVEKTALNAQLTESRISTMMSQIRPHFIYNTLGTIEQLCELDPDKAGELVHDFAKYLRGNFGELANVKPIPMSQEMEHVYHYIRIENVRFPDMTFLFEMNAKDFYIPALSIQPIVENAIKHGLFKLEKGGTIKVISYETNTHYLVSIEDDGIGFDTSVLVDEKEHVGLHNIRARLEAMVNGELEIESTIGVGTKVLIKIPKEGLR